MEQRIAMIKRSMAGVILPMFVLLNLLWISVDQTAHAGGLRETRKAVDAIEINDVDLTVLPPGRYEGSFIAPLVSATVRVTVNDGRMEAIEVLEHNHGPRHGAEEITQAVLVAQSLQVDVVSGATGSSRAILKAIENALTGR